MSAMRKSTGTLTKDGVSYCSCWKLLASYNKCSVIPIARVEILTMQAVRVVDYILKHVDACTNSSGKLKHESKTSPPRCQYISEYKIRQT